MQAMASRSLRRVGLQTLHTGLLQALHKHIVQRATESTASSYDNKMSYILEWTRQQREMRPNVNHKDDVDWSVHPDAGTLKFVGGVDISFFKSDPKHACAVEVDVEAEQGVAALVVVTFPDMEVVYSDVQVLPLGAPYIPGFLGFREVPAYMELLERLKQLEGGRLMPQVILVDGCGLLHPQQFGSACHLGVISGIPTVGVAKNLLVVDGLDRLVIEQHILDKRARMQQQREQRQQAQHRQDHSQSISLVDHHHDGSDTQNVLPGQPSLLAMHADHDHIPSDSTATSTYAGLDSAAALNKSYKAQGDAGVSQSVPSQAASQVADVPDDDLAALQCELDAAAGGHHTVMPLVGTSGKVWGAALCSNTSKKPLYISTGHRLGLVTAVQLVSMCCVHRVPEPTRQADLRSRQAARDIMAQSAAGT